MSGSNPRSPKLAPAVTLAELARWTGGDIVRGDSGACFTGMAALDAAGPGDVSFLGNERYHGQFLQTLAGAVIVPQGEKGGPPAAALIAVENPTLAFSVVVRHFVAEARCFTAGVSPAAFVDPDAVMDPARVRLHPGAVVMAGARIGNGTELGPNCVVGEGAVIGDDCHLMANVSVRERCILGNRVILQPGCVIGSDGFGYELVGGRHAKIDQVGIVEIGDDVEIGANTTIDRARFGKTVIGEGTKIDNLVQIGHNCVIGRHCLIVALAGISGSTRLGDYVTVAGQVGMAGHVTVGDKATLGARAGVTSNLPGGAVYAGNPAQPFRDEMKQRANTRRLPKLIERVKALEEALAKSTREPG